LFLFSIFTDLADGYIARKYKTTSRAGAYYDTLADFGVIIGVFTIFIVKGVYPSWILAIIIISFALFMITSRYGTQIYDPIGKYWGILLYGSIAATVLFQTEALYMVAQLAITGFFIVSFITRIAWIARNATRKDDDSTRSRR
jgi:phosphatidylglycerophosphate synthase